MEKHGLISFKIGKTWADIVFDFFAKDILCSGKTIEERKCNLVKLYQEVSPNFIRSLNDDIDKIKNRTFENNLVKVEYGNDTFTPYFLINYTTKMLNIVPGYKEISNELTLEDGYSKMLFYYYPPNRRNTGIIAAGSTGINIRQTPSNSDSNIISIKLIEALKKSSELFFKRLYSICEIPDLNIDKPLPDMEKLEKYKNKCALVIYENKKKILNLMSCHCIINTLLLESGLFNKIDFLNYNTLTGVYGEKEDIYKFLTIIYAQQFPDKSPSMNILRMARGL